MLVDRVAEWTPARVAARTGVPAGRVVEMAHAIGTNGPLSYYTYNGVEQHVDTAQTTRAICILYALTGWLEAEGGNVSFAGAPGDSFDGMDLLGAEQNAKRLGFPERPLSAARRSITAYDLYDAVLGEGPYPVRALVSFGGNMIVQHGDTGRGRRAFEALAFHVHADAFMNPSAETADIVLPTTTAWESAHVSLNLAGGPDTMARIQYRPAVVAPQHELRPDLRAIFELAVALGLGRHFWDGDVEEAFRATLRRSGVSLEALKESPGGIQLDIEQTYRKYAIYDGDGRVRGFATPSRKVEIYSEAYLDRGYDPLPSAPPPLDGGRDFPLRLTSYKLAEYCHSQGRGVPSLRRQAPAPFLEIHPETAARFEVEDGGLVSVATPRGRIELRARVTDEVLPGVVAAHTGWWEACEEIGLPGYDPLSEAGANLNLVMSNDVFDPISGSVPHKSYPCAVRPLGAVESGDVRGREEVPAE